MPEYVREVEVACAAAREAGRVILQVYATPFEVTQKGGSEGPVTEADTRANELIVAALRRAFPHDSIFAEESGRRDQTGSPRRWFVDPLDGTREFVDRNGMFAVHVGLAVDGVPAVGVVYAPVTDTLWVGEAGGAGTVEVAGVRAPLRVAPVAELRAARLLVSRSQPSALAEAFARELGIADVRAVGSVGLKCGLIAKGAADLYLNPGPHTSRWDSCAPEAVLRAAGGVVTDLAGVAYSYDGAELDNRRGLLAGSAALVQRVLPVATRLARQAGLLS